MTNSLLPAAIPLDVVLHDALHADKVMTAAKQNGDIQTYKTFRDMRDFSLRHALAIDSTFTNSAWNEATPKLRGLALTFLNNIVSST